MKKSILNAATALALLFAASSILTSCKKKDDSDTTKPVVTLNGSSTEYSVLNAAYTDPEATATDDKDGSLTSKIVVTGSVNKDITGTYTLTYSATDAAGNTGSASRTVIVYNEASDYLGGSKTTATFNYNVTENCDSIIDNFTQTISISTTINRRVHFSKFADYTNNTSIYANVTSNSIDLPSQTGNDIGSNSEDHVFAGTGSINTSTYAITLNFTNTNNSVSPPATTNCTHIYTPN